MTGAGIATAPAIRPMRQADLTEVARMEAALYPYPWSLGNFRDSLTAGYSCWVMLAGQEMIGYAVLMVGVEETHLLNLSVQAARHRSGLGTLMMDHLLEVSRQCAANRLLLEVRRSNAAARAFYAVHGFQELGERRAYYPAGDGREDAIIMEKML